ncbi:MAG TPA: glycerol-3-phosphate acyltransferase [Verrucomicrobiae bacterium]|nr:glycerol-3-phosphate acyltransferase [Verrucomicrobiae bacterium]
MAWAEQMQTVGALETLGCVLGAYALGCFATGYYLVRARTGQDIRELESGSIGARNVGRALGKTGFTITLLGDFAKGAFAVWAVRHFSGSHLLAALAMVSVVAGHIWPATLQFHGGKGAATSLGALLVYDPELALVFVVCCLPGALLFRKITLPAMVAYACLPVASYWLHRDSVEVTLLGVLASLVIFAHRQNLLKEIPALIMRRDLSVKPQPPKP